MSFCPTFVSVIVPVKLDIRLCIFHTILLTWKAFLLLTLFFFMNDMICLLVNDMQFESTHVCHYRKLVYSFLLNPYTNIAILNMYCHWAPLFVFLDPIGFSFQIIQLAIYFILEYQLWIVSPLQSLLTIYRNLRITLMR